MVWTTFKISIIGIILMLIIGIILMLIAVKNGIILMLNNIIR